METWLIVTLVLLAIWVIGMVIAFLCTRNSSKNEIVGDVVLWPLYLIGIVLESL